MRLCNQHKMSCIANRSRDKYYTKQENKNYLENSRWATLKFSPWHYRFLHIHCRFVGLNKIISLSNWSFLPKFYAFSGVKYRMLFKIPQTI